ncbi:hypothetical protein OKA04_12865 [Luteolibacter flavescens]|uniref:GIY-YIG nuclease family protein n=1 Tax=Luteolibacter flavescens TaxID=1859460 RepID=A0ABT3FPX2_9BACT|nr:hypothetical protein [Luteolibacter flavescens]MCW1885623.1 hypothetical protein [Luteolibacter flavescens]
MDSKETIIHIDWSGPYSLDDVAKFNGPEDWGVYQIYGSHPVYGSGALLYIGKTESDPSGFAGRVPRSAGWSHLNPDSARIEIYLGRLFGLTMPDNATWERYIGYAERLLIYAHTPARNLRWELIPSDPDLFRVHVVNWRQYRDLLPEVSGAKWTDRFDDVPYDSHFSVERLE